MKIDISIEGIGFFSITGLTKRGMRCVDSNVQGSASGAACSDDQNLTQAIAEGATAKGLRVSVNGYLYLAGGLRGEAA